MSACDFLVLPVATLVAATAHTAARTAAPMMRAFIETLPSFGTARGRRIGLDHLVTARDWHTSPMLVKTTFTSGHLQPHECGVPALPKSANPATLVLTAHRRRGCRLSSVTIR